MAKRPPTQGNSKDSYRNKGRGERKSTEKESKKLTKAVGGKRDLGTDKARTDKTRADRNGPDRNNPESRNNRQYKDGYNAKDLEKLTEIKKDFKKSGSNRVHYENDFIFWCRKCNVPLIGEKCGLCSDVGEKITLSQPADVRFAQGYENELIQKHLQALFSCNPLEGRVLLLNKIPGDDQTLEIIADGFVIGLLRFDLKKLDFVFEPTLHGSKLFFNPPYDTASAHRVVKIEKAKTHLNGKNITFNIVEDFPPTIQKGEAVLISSGSLTGYGISHIDGSDFNSIKSKNESKEAALSTKSDSDIKEMQVLKVKNITSDTPDRFVLSDKKPTMEDIVAANKEFIKALGKNSMNTIKGAVNLKEHKEKPVFVSFSGGKDSLVVLDLAVSALVHKPFTAVFLNTGIDYPETVAFARSYCADRQIPFKEMDAGNGFWNTLKEKDHPTKDSRWCCKVCKLDSSNRLADGKEHLSLDGKRRQESFMRSKIPTMDINPNVDGQLNIFPIRDWRAIEVWLYIHWRKLPYNSLYDNGLERIGCWMCPAAFQAEYERMKEIHPELAGKWEKYLVDWAARTGVSDKYIAHGFWRWQELPPKMVKLAEELDIKIEKNGN